MKRLGLLRHAKSSWDEPALDDFDRPLNGRGRKAAQRIGREMQSLGIRYDLALVSPARRASQTFDLLRSQWTAKLEWRHEPRLYLASPDRLLALAAAVPDRVERLLLVGHNPGFHALAMRLADADESNGGVALSEKFPTGALAEIDLPIGQWCEAEERGGSLARFVRPRDLA